MNIIPQIIIVALALGVTACANLTATVAAQDLNRELEASGSPFRWKTKTQNVRGDTVMTLGMVDLPSGSSHADPILKKDILALITKTEGTKSRGEPQVEDIKLLPDGREVWVLKSEEDGIAYIVGLRPSPQGGTDIELSGPTMYQKNE